MSIEKCRETLGLVTEARELMDRAEHLAQWLEGPTLRWIRETNQQIRSIESNIRHELCSIERKAIKELKP